MPDLAVFLTEEAGKPVIDATGLKGRYDFTLAWISERPGIPKPAGDQPAEPGATIFQALRKQAGLTLVERKRPVSVTVIDKADKTPVVN